MADSQRVNKVSKLIKEEFGRIILKEVDLPKGVLATITGVETFPNLQKSRVFVSVAPREKTEEVLKILKREIFSLQQNLNHKLRMRPVPKIEFFEDRKLEKGQEIERILDNLNQE